MSLHFMSVGVGVLIAFGNTGVSYSQTPPDGQPQRDILTIAQQTSEENSATTSTIGDLQTSKIGEIAKPLRQTSQKTPNFLTAQFPSAKAQLPKLGDIAQAFSSNPQKQTDRPLKIREVAQVFQTAQKPAIAVPKPASLQGTLPLSLVAQVPKSRDVSRVFGDAAKLPEVGTIAKTFASAPPKTGDSVAQTPRTQTPTAPSRQTTPLPPSTAPSRQTTPAPASTTPTAPPTPSQNPAPSAPTPGRTAPAPDYLNPSPNPLQFPTRPEEVRLQGTQPITLAQAIELSERNNRDLQVARLQLERTQASLREAQAANAPTLGLQADLSRSQSASSELSAKVQEQRQQNNPFAQTTDNDNPGTTLNGSIQLNYDIYTSGLRKAQILAAERQVRVNELEVERTREELRLNVSSDYYDLQESDEQVRINAAAVRNAEISLRDTQAQERAGLGTRFDVLRSQVNLANSQQQLTNAIATQAVRRRQLSQRISIAESVNLSAADPVVPAGTWTLPIEDSIVLAYKSRAELEQQLAQRESSEQQRRAALATLGPTVSVSAQYNLLDVFEQPVRVTDGYSFGLQARWNLYDGGAAVARAQQQEKDKEIAETRFAQSRNNIRFQVEQAYTTLQSNRTNIDTAGTALNQAREALRLARLRFQAGVGTQTDVINAETDLTRSEGSLVSAIIGYNRSLAQLQRSVSNISRQ